MDFASSAAPADFRLTIVFASAIGSLVMGLFWRQFSAWICAFALKTLDDFVGQMQQKRTETLLFLFSVSVIGQMIGYATTSLVIEASFLLAVIHGVCGGMAAVIVAVLIEKLACGVLLPKFSQANINTDSQKVSDNG